jgi:hypothetical protein
MLHQVRELKPDSLGLRLLWSSFFFLVRWQRDSRPARPFGKTRRSAEKIVCGNGSDS